jgi:hypothetical protein
MLILNQYHIFESYKINIYSVGYTGWLDHVQLEM